MAWQKGDTRSFRDINQGRWISGVGMRTQLSPNYLESTRSQFVLRNMGRLTPIKKKKQVLDGTTVSMFRGTSSGSTP